MSHVLYLDTNTLNRSAPLGYLTSQNGNLAGQGVVHSTNEIQSLFFFSAQILEPTHTDDCTVFSSLFLLEWFFVVMFGVFVLVWVLLLLLNIQNQKATHTLPSL